MSSQSQCSPRLFIAAALAGVLTLTFHAGTQAKEPAPVASAVAAVGKDRITDADVMAQAKDKFQSLQDDFDSQSALLKARLERKRSELLQQELGKLLDKRAVELEAKARGVTPVAVLADIKVTAVTDDEARAFYESHKERTSQTYDQLESQIKQYLANQHNESATRGFYDALRAKHGITVLLAPYRVRVAATGPARGSPSAPVTIVEFGDFQCPYCGQAESTLRAVLAKHPDDVRLVFRHLPLTSLHPNAQIAAEAAVCADAQGKFWEMHDAMFGDQSSLAASSLQQTAQRLGLDTGQFASCLSDAKTSQTVAADAKAANALGVSGTPSFFINGRLIDGNVPQEQFEALIGEELQHASNRRGG